MDTISSELFVLLAVDFMPEAKAVMKLAATLSDCQQVRESDAFGHELINTLQREIKVVLDYMKSIPVQYSLCAALRTRIEYILFIVHHCLAKVSFVTGQH